MGTGPLQVKQGRFDNTDHTIFGAYVNARIIASRLATFEGVGAAIREEARTYDAMNPVDPKIPASGKTDWKKPEGSREPRAVICALVKIVSKRKGGKNDE